MAAEIILHILDKIMQNSQAINSQQVSYRHIITIVYIKYYCYKTMPLLYCLLTIVIEFNCIVFVVIWQMNAMA